MSNQHPVRSFENLETGDVRTGEFVVESSNAWQVAVKGKVTVLLKTEWRPRATISDFGGLFEGLFGGAQ